MALNLIDMAKSYLTPDVVEKFGNATGLSPEQTESALGAAIPTTLAGILQNASTDQGAKRVFDTLKQGSFDGSMLSNTSERLSGGNMGGLLETGKGLLSSLFGDRTDNVGEQLSRYTGVERSSLMKILAMVAPFVMNLLSKVKKEQGLSEGGFRQLLMSQKDTILKHVPSGLAGALGLSSLADLGGAAGQVKEKAGQWVREGSERAQTVSQATYGKPQKSSQTSKALWIALASLGLLAAFWFMRDRRGREMAQAPAPQPTRVATDAPTLSGEPTGNLIRITLPNGESIQLERDSTAHRLAETLKAGPNGAAQRVEFRELEFVRDQNTPSGSSTRSIGTVATVLKASPNARIRIRAAAPENDEAAQQLAVDRAERIKTILVERGAPSERVIVDPIARAAGESQSSGIELIVEAPR